MLDKLPIGEKESHEVLSLECEKCGMTFDETDDEELLKDFKSIEETGTCLICHAEDEAEEWGNVWPG